MRRSIGTLLVCASLAGGCAAGVRVYDPPYHDYHRWDDREEHEYRGWLAERHMEYRAYGRLDRRDQEAYWHWRHDHRGRDHDRR